MKTPIATAIVSVCLTLEAIPASGQKAGGPRLYLFFGGGFGSVGAPLLRSLQGRVRCCQGVRFTPFTIRLGL